MEEMGPEAGAAAAAEGSTWRVEGDKRSLRLLMANEIGSGKSRGKSGCQEEKMVLLKCLHNQKNRDECLH